MSFQHANMIATQVLANIKAVKEDIIQAMEEQQPDENTPPEQHANSATSDNVQVEIFKLLRSMQGTLKDLKSNKGNHNKPNNKNKNSSRDSNSKNSKDSRNSNNYNRWPFGNGRIDKYYSSHGACNHKSENYFYKDDGHKDNAILENKISGSTRARTGS